MKYENLGLVRLLIHKYDDEFEILESELFQNDWLYTTYKKNRPTVEWMGEIISENTIKEEIQEILKDIKKEEFYAEIIAELHVEYGHTGPECEYDESSSLVNEKFNILNDDEVSFYLEMNPPTDFLTEMAQEPEVLKNRKNRKNINEY